MSTPRSLDEALAVKASRPEAVPIAGGTDLMVGLNFGHLRPDLILDLTRVDELRDLKGSDGSVRLGALTTFSEIIGRHDHRALLQAARTVGSPQIRNRATIGGNLGTASPAGDSLPVFVAYRAEVVVGAEGTEPRSIPIESFLVGPKRTALDPHELILAIEWPTSTGLSVFSKVGFRNAMVISVASLCLALEKEKKSVRIALGSVGPTILRAQEAEALLEQVLEDVNAWDDPRALVDPEAIEDVAEAVRRAADPIDDVRATARYRRHACGILVKRALAWATADRRADLEEP